MTLDYRLHIRDKVLGLRICAFDLIRPEDGGVSHAKHCEHACTIIRTGCFDYLNHSEGVGGALGGNLPLGISNSSLTVRASDTDETTLPCNFVVTAAAAPTRASFSPSSSKED